MSVAHKMKAERHRRASSLMVALIASIVLFATFLMCQRPYFYTNDDTTIQSILCGARTGDPNPFTIYTNYWLSCGVANLYRLSPHVAWWFLVLEGSQFLVLFAWCYLTHRIVEHRLSDSARYRALYSLAITFLSGACWSYLPVVRPSYTFASACLSTMGVVLFYVSLDYTWLTKNERKIGAFLSVILQALGCAMRYKSGMVGVAFTGVLTAVFLVRYLCNKDDEVKREARQPLWRRSLILWLVPICSATLVFGGQALHLQAYNTDEWRAFDQLNKVRSAFMDYPHDSFEENPTLYGDVGWDQPLADLVQRWFFMDRRVTEEAFVHLVKGSSMQSASPWRTLMNNLVSHKGIFADGLFLCMASVTVSLASVLFCHIEEGQSRLLGILVLTIGLCATAYVASTGRMIFRAAYCALLPAICVVWFILLEHMSTVPDGRGQQKTPVALCGSVTLLGAAIIVAWTATLGIPAHAFCVVGLAAPLATLSFALPRKRSFVRPDAIWLMSLAVVSALVLASTQQAIVRANKSRFRNANQVAAMMRNARSHPEMIYIYPASYATTDPFQSFSHNVIAWGGWSYFAPWSSDLYVRLGYPEGMDAGALFDENVCFVSTSDRLEQVLHTYLESIADGDVHVELVDELGEDGTVYSYSVARVDSA